MHLEIRELLRSGKLSQYPALRVRWQVGVANDKARSQGVSNGTESSLCFPGKMSRIRIGQVCRIADDGIQRNEIGDGLKSFRLVCELDPLMRRLKRN